MKEKKNKKYLRKKIDIVFIHSKSYESREKNYQFKKKICEEPTMYARIIRNKPTSVKTTFGSL